MPAAEQDNALTAEEQQWMIDLRVAAKEAGISYPNKFWLASFALVAKGDIKKGLKRMENWNSVEKAYRLSEVSREEATAWAKITYPGLMVPYGTNKEDQLSFGTDYSQFFPSKLKTAEDWRYFLRMTALNLQSVNPTLAHVRRGAAAISLLSSLSVSNIGLTAEKKMASLWQDAFPMKFKKIYLVDLPKFATLALKAVSLCLKAKVAARLTPIPRSELAAHFDESQLPTQLGGSFTDDFWAERDRRLALYEQSVAEVEARY